MNLDEMLAQIRQAIDTYLSSTGKSIDPEHPEVYDKLNWESRSSEKGPYQMLKKDDCNDTQLFSHLKAVLGKNKNNVSIGDYHYWAGDEGYIFRRLKKQ